MSAAFRSRVAATGGSLGREAQENDHRNPFLSAVGAAGAAYARGRAPTSTGTCTGLSPLQGSGVDSSPPALGLTPQATPYRVSDAQLSCCARALAEATCRACPPHQDSAEAGSTLKRGIWIRSRATLRVRDMAWRRIRTRTNGEEEPQ